MINTTSMARIACCTNHGAAKKSGARVPPPGDLTHPLMTEHGKAPGDSGRRGQHAPPAAPTVSVRLRPFHSARVRLSAVGKTTFAGQCDVIRERNTTPLAPGGLVSLDVDGLARLRQRREQR